MRQCSGAAKTDCPEQKTNTINYLFSRAPCQSTILYKHRRFSICYPCRSRLTQTHASTSVWGIACIVNGHVTQNHLPSNPCTIAMLWLRNSTVAKAREGNTIIQHLPGGFGQVKSQKSWFPCACPHIIGFNTSDPAGIPVGSYESHPLRPLVHGQQHRLWDKETLSPCVCLQLYRKWVCVRVGVRAKIPFIMEGVYWLPHDPQILE